MHLLAYRLYFLKRPLHWKYIRPWNWPTLRPDQLSQQSIFTTTQYANNNVRYNQSQWIPVRSTGSSNAITVLADSGIYSNLSGIQGCIVHLGHRAMARPIIEGISRVRARKLVMSRISRMRVWPTAVNSRVRTRHYLPCREFAREWFGLTRTCTYTTIDNVAKSHARDLG